MAMFGRKEQVTGVAYYCKDCERIVDAHQVGRKYVYSCNICKTKNVAFGTERSIRSYFKFDDPIAPEKSAPASAGGAASAPAAVTKPVEEKPAGA